MALRIEQTETTAYTLEHEEVKNLVEVFEDDFPELKAMTEEQLHGFLTKQIEEGGEVLSWFNEMLRHSEDYASDTRVVTTS